MAENAYQAWFKEKEEIRRDNLYDKQQARIERRREAKKKAANKIRYYMEYVPKFGRPKPFPKEDYESS